MMASSSSSPMDKIKECLKRWKRESIHEATMSKQLSYGGKKDIIKLRELQNLVEKEGADLKYLEREGGFALIPHVFWSKELIQFFVDRGADPNSRDEEGDTALHLAIRHANYDEKPKTNYWFFIEKWFQRDNFDPARQVIKYLLYHLNIDPKVQNLRGETALFKLVRYTYMYSKNGKERLLEVVEMLLERGTDVTIRNKDGESVLHPCNSNINKRLIEEFGGRDLDIRTSDWLYSSTPLMAAARYSDEEMFRILIERGAFVNATDLQGYTALHHAVVRRNYGCARFLIENGADPNVKSSSGRDAFDLSIGPDYMYIDEVLLRGATPTKQVEILVIVGAMKILQKPLVYAIEFWDKAMDVCKKFDLKPSQEFLTNYEFLKENPNQANEEIVHISAMNTVARLPNGTKKLWNLFVLPISSIYGFNNERHSYVFRILTFFSKEVKCIEDFASMEEMDFNSLLTVVLFFDRWLKNLVESRSKNEATPEKISKLHFISKLVIACFDKFMGETNSNMTPNAQLYVTTCRVLTTIHVCFADVMSTTAFNENKRLLKKLINLDLKDRDSNSLLHLVLSWWRYKSYDSELISALLDLDIVNVKTRNLMGFEPAQKMSMNSLDVMVKLADRGAHVDYVMKWPSMMTMRQAFEKEGRPDLAFRYDTLQCACARVLAKSLVPYANRVPKVIIDFIRMH